MVLEKGLNFTVKPRAILVKEIIGGGEAALKDFPETDMEAIRGAVSGILQTTQPLKGNLSRWERDALRTLRNDKQIVILKADKAIRLCC